MVKQYLIYAGSAFRLEWYIDSNGQSEAKEYFEKLPKQEKDKALKYMNDYLKRTQEQTYYEKD